MDRKLFLSIFIAIIFTCVSVQIINAQNKAEKKSSVTETNVPMKYEPSPSHRFGRLNPNAPPETAQFAFMIGEFECDDKIVDQKGKWFERKVVWNSKYFLNGSGIQDSFWSNPTIASGTRVFDKNKGKWIVNYFQTFPTYFAGVWEGKKEGDKMIMRAPRGKNGERESRLTFHNITKDSFEWIGEMVTKKDGKANPFWIISCKRRR